MIRIIQSVEGMTWRPGLLLAAALASLVLVAGSSSPPANADTISIPRQRAGGPPTGLRAPKARARLLPRAPISSLVVGLNFESSELNDDSGFVPPDTMGAVGPHHIVETINGNVEIFRKSDGTSLDSRSLDGFWTSTAGVTIPNFNDTCDLMTGKCTVSGNTCTSNANCVRNFTFDPRIVFDPASNRWFVSALDGTNPANGHNNLYLARSDTDDPTAAWKGLRFDTDTVGAAEFHDYDTLAVDADGLYMCTNDFNDGGHESCYSIPKADIVAAAPTIANMTRFEATPAGLPSVDGSLQPALGFGASDGHVPLLGASGGMLTRSNINGGGAAGATLGAITAITGDPGHATAPAARQPHPSNRTIENVSPRFVANVFEVGDSLWAVHSVKGSGSNAALRWYEINEATNTVLQTGLIDDPDEDYHEPSIAVNPSGNVVIGYTCSGPNLAPSSCVSVGETVAGVTTFGSPMNLQLGDGYYWEDFAAPPNEERNRWGDYSATVVDPTNPCVFWTFQEYVAVSATGDVGPSPLSDGGLWGVEITQLILTQAECAADLAITKTDRPDPVSPGDDLFYDVSVLNKGPGVAVNVVVKDTLPVGVTFIDDTDSCVEGPPGVLTCTLGDIALNETRTFTIHVRVNANVVADACEPQSLTNNAEVSATTSDPDLGNNAASATTALSFPLNHFLCYEVERPPVTIRSGVTLDDVFGPGIVDVGLLKRLCTPTDKNGEDPTAPLEPCHLTGYAIRTQEPTRYITRVVTNQFGSDELEVGRSELILVPTAKDRVAPPPALVSPTIDHFKCHRVRRSRQRVPALALVDQIDARAADILKPFRLCSPADKNEGGILDPDTHLMCYKIKAVPSRPSFTGPFFITNQFDDLAIDLTGTRELCVPSTVTVPIFDRQ